MVQAKYTAIFDAAGRVHEGGGGIRQRPRSEICGPVGGTKLDVVCNAGCLCIGLGTGKANGVLLVRDHGSVPGEGERIAANTAAQVQDWARRSMAVDQPGAVQRDRPCSGLLQGFGGEVHSVCIGEFCRGTMPQLGERKQRSGLCNREVFP